eukprot:g13568.t1
MTSIASSDAGDSKNKNPKMRGLKRGMRRVGGETFIATFKIKTMEEFTVEEALVVNVYCQTDSSTTSVVVHRTKEQSENQLLDVAINTVAKQRSDKLEKEKAAAHDQAKDFFMEFLSNDSKDVSYDNFPRSNTGLLNVYANRNWPDYLKAGDFDKCIRHCKRLVTEARRKGSASFFEELGADVPAIVSNAYKVMGDALVETGTKKYSHAINAYVLALRENESNAKAKIALEQLRKTMNEQKEAKDKQKAASEGGTGPSDSKKKEFESTVTAVAEIEDLLAHHQMVSRDVNFKFQCTMCGECCRQADNIFLTPTDIWRMARTPSLWKLFKIRTTLKLRQKFKKSFHWTVHNGLPICYLRPVKSSTGRCHYSYPLYHVDNKLLSYQETVDEGLLEEEVYVPVKPEEYNFTEEEEAAALAKLNEQDMKDIENMGQPEESSADDAGDDEDAFGSNDDENKEETKMDSTKASKKKKKGKKRTKEPASLPVSVLNSYGRQALGCSLGQKHMPNMCAGYPIAKELSWADFWHVRQTDKEGKREAKCNTAKSGDGEKIVIVKTDACEGFYADDAPRTQPFSNVNPIPGVAEERPMDDFIKSNDLDRRWDENDWFMKLLDEVSKSGIMDRLQNNTEVRAKFQGSLARIWFDPDRLAAEKTVGLQGSWKTVARAVEDATKRIIDEYRQKYALF